MLRAVEKQQIPILVFGLIRSGLEPQIAELVLNSNNSLTILSAYYAGDELAIYNRILVLRDKKLI
jgi:hypothetical protein